MAIATAFIDKLSILLKLITTKKNRLFKLQIYCVGSMAE